MQKRSLIILLVVIMFLGLVPLEARAISFDEINNSAYYFTQWKNWDGSCNLVSNVNMLRRYAIIRGDTNWQTITREKFLAGSKYTPNGTHYGPKYSYTWDEGLSGGTIKVQQGNAPSNKRQFLIDYLKNHPEGIIIYRSSPSDKAHAVLVTDYTDGQFYCIDPVISKNAKRIPISQAWSVNIDNYNQYWYVASPQVSLKDNYTITFNDMGSISTITKPYGSALGSLPLIIRNGYSFDGWYTAASGGTKISSSTVVTGNVTYYAHWTANTYTVSYNANGGSSNSSVNKTHGSTLGTLPTPSRTGYSFDGWYTAVSGGSKVSTSTTVTGNVTYYAHWTANIYTTLALDYVMAGSGKEIKVPIRLDQNPGIMIVTMTIGYDKTKLSFEGVEDGKFKEWIVNKEKGTISWFGPSDKYSNGTIVTLVFKTTNNFNGIADITLEKVEAANQREESVVFSKSDGKVIFNESLSYYIGYHPNKGTGAPESQSFTNFELVREVAISIDEDLLARASLDAYIASGDESRIQGALANWELRRQAVLEATKNLELVNETGKNLSQTKPTRSGYIFQGWATNVKLVTINGEKEYSGEVVYQPGDTYKEAKDTVVLFAIWSPITYAIKYNDNGGSGAPAAQTKTYGTALTLSNTKPTRSGYTFQGWSTTKDGNAAYQPGGSYTANEAVTLYAVWKINTYKVKFDANGGSGAPAAQTKTYGKTLTLSSTSPTLTGHTFQGWATSKDGSAAYQPGGNYTANKAVTLYAVWEKNAENTMTLEIGKASGVKGGKIVLPIKLRKNVGVSSMRLMADFDSSKLKLTGVKDGDMKGWTFNSDKNILIWYNEKDYTSNGTVVSLEFEIIKNFTGDTSIGLKEATAADDTKEYNLTVNKGTISYSSRLPGDVNDDKKVSLVDLVRLCKYLAGYDVEIHALNSDVTADGKVSLVDLVRLCKYLAGYNVVLE